MHPNKKRKIHSFNPDYVSEALAQFDLEIALRERFAQTVEQRIAWASILCEDLEHLSGTNRLSDVETSGERLSYSAAARDAWDAMHDSCLIFSILHQAASPLAIPGPPKTFPNRLQSRSHRLASGRNQTTKPKFLYIKVPAQPGYNSAGVYVLKCPTCLRTSFTSLQGLLNHARIGHKLEWGTHDDCIRACAVPYKEAFNHEVDSVRSRPQNEDPISSGQESQDYSKNALNQSRISAEQEPDLDGGVEIGNNASSILPSLQRLFQMAVGDEWRSNPLTLGNPSALSEYLRMSTDKNVTPQPLKPASDQDSLLSQYPSKPTHAMTNQRSDESIPSISSSAVVEPPPSDSNTSVANSTHLSRTLGHHIDTPALASFLGRTPKRRAVRVWNQEDNVDIDNFDHDYSPSEYLTSSRTNLGTIKLGRLKWRIPPSHRNGSFGTNISSTAESITTPHDLDQTTSENVAMSSLSSSVPEVEMGAPETTQSTQELPLGMNTGQSSRFHIVTRVLITDRSWWIPPERRNSKGTNQHTHKWMISVEAPSYSNHITSVLKELRVSPSDYQPHLTSRTSDIKLLATTEPPFIVVGTTAHPFLAKIELIFNGVQGNGVVEDGQTVLLEHWVELDPLKNLHPITGDEQVVDIELDRRTLTRPPRKDCTNIGARSLWDIDKPGNQDVSSRSSPSVNGEMRHSNVSDNHIQGYEQILKELLPKFPMTIKDAKGRARTPQMHVPYKLVATPSQFRSLIMGRRKAIEWGRARAIYDAYKDIAGNHPITLEYPEQRMELNIADIYKWLEVNRCFIRERDVLERTQSNTADEKATETGRDQLPRLEGSQFGRLWCGICGLFTNIHSLLEQGEIQAPQKEREDPSGHDDDCPIVPKQLRKTNLPLLDLHRLEISHHQTTNYQVPSPGIDSVKVFTRWKYRDLLAVVEPVMVMRIRRIIDALGFPTFASPSCSTSSNVSGMPTFPLDELGQNRDDVEAHLAPYALLGILIRRLIVMLIQGGLEVSMRDRERGLKLLLAGKSKEERPSEVQPVKRSNAAKTQIKKTLLNGVKVLTPGQVLRSIAEGHGKSTANGDPTDRLKGSLYLCLGRLGVGVDEATERTQVGSLSALRDLKQVVNVKIEDPV